MAQLNDNGLSSDAVDRILNEISDIFTRFVRSESGVTCASLPAPQTPARRRKSTHPEAVVDYGKLAAELYAQRRKRDQVFNLPDLLGEPVWDILLDLTIAHARSEKISVSAAIIGSGVPGSTGLRYLGVLEKKGLIERTPDVRDRRRTWVSLSNAGAKLMHDALDAMMGIRAISASHYSWSDKSR